MANLNIENLSQIVQSGNIEKLYSGTQNEVASNTSAAAEMYAQGSPVSTTQDSGKSFSDILKNSVEQVNLYQNQADTAVKELIAGRNKNIHETMLTIERADTSLKLMMQVRNKILDAYREIMRMQV
jgi:flagellar hook-basal body complex protein FliE